MGLCWSVTPNTSLVYNSGAYKFVTEDHENI
jgi:hypothetical protein